MYIANRKIFRIFFRPPMWAHLTELLSVFDVESLYDVVNRKRSKVVCSNLGYKFDEVVFLTLYTIRGG